MPKLHTCILKPELSFPLIPVMMLAQWVVKQHCWRLAGCSAGQALSLLR